MTKRYTTRPTQWLVVPEDSPSLYNEYALTISIDDEGGGEYVRITSASMGDTERSISFDREAWPAVQHVVEVALREIVQHENEVKEDD